MKRMFTFDITYYITALLIFSLFIVLKGIFEFLIIEAFL